MGNQQAAAGNAGNSTPANAVQGNGSTRTLQGGRTGASTASEAGNLAARSQTLGRDTASQPSRTGTAPQTRTFDNEALNRLPESGWRRFGTQSESGASNTQSTTQKPTTEPGTKPQTVSTTKPGAAPAPRTTAEPQSGWHRFGDRPQPNANTSSGRSQSPRVNESAQPRTSIPAQNNRSGFESFSQADRARSSVPASGSPAPRSAGQEQGSWQRFAPQPRPAPTERNVESFGTRSGSAYPSWNRAPSRTEIPSYRQPQVSYQRPQLEISKPIVTERAPAGTAGGSRNSPPSSSGSRGSSSSGSHSGGHSKR